MSKWRARKFVHDFLLGQRTDVGSCAMPNTSLAIETTDGTPNCASHAARCGMWSPKITKLAGFEIGSTKLAALAMNAQMNK